MVTVAAVCDVVQNVARVIGLALPPCNWRQGGIYSRHSISRCALLNVPAGSFSRDIDQLNFERVVFARGARMRFGEENDDRYCEVV